MHWVQHTAYRSTSLCLLTLNKDTEMNMPQMDVEGLLFCYWDRLTQEQRLWLQIFSDLWKTAEDNNDDHWIDALQHAYTDWLERETLKD